MTTTRAKRLLAGLGLMADGDRLRGRYSRLQVCAREYRFSSGGYERRTVEELLTTTKLMTDELCQVVIPAAFGPLKGGGIQRIVQEFLDPGFRREGGMLVMFFVKLISPLHGPPSRC